MNDETRHISLGVSPSVYVKERIISTIVKSFMTAITEGLIRFSANTQKNPDVKSRIA